MKRSSKSSPKKKAATPSKTKAASTSPVSASQDRKRSTSAQKRMSKERTRINNDAIEPFGVTTADHAPYDPEIYRPHQLEWWRKVVKKDYKFYAFYVLAFLVFTLVSEPCAPGHSGHAGRLLSSTSRVVFTSICGVLAAFTLYVDIAHSTPPEPGDRKWRLLLDGHSGHFSYLTVNILTTWAVYWPYCAIVEWAWLYSDAELVRKAVTAVYTFAVFSSTLGTLLTLLFLKFNWYEPSWRKETLEMYEARGNTMFRKKILFTHLNQLPVAFFDVVVLKQNHHILEWATPSLSVVFLVCFVYSLVYLSFTHLNYRTNGGVYPYSFMDKVFKEWKSEIIFFVVLSLFCFIVCAFYHFIAEEADYVEEAMIQRIKSVLIKST